MKIKEAFDNIHNSNDLRKKIWTITISFTLLISASLLKEAFKKPEVYVDKNGEVIAIERKSMHQIDEYPLQIELYKDGKTIKKDVNISTKIVKKKNKNIVKKQNEKEEEAVTDAEIDRIVLDIENSKKKRIELPRKLPSGSKIKWYSRNKSSSSVYGIFIMYFFIITILILDTFKKNNGENKKLRNDIMRGLPRFTNQMMLMMNSGIILSDALKIICRSYEIIPEKKRSFFEKALIKANETNNDSRLSTAMLMNEFASKYGVKELMRISSILSENEKRGSDIINKLFEESHFLWEERKIMAKEKGKMIDTKMVWPLGLLLILLIIITMAPALIAM